MCLKKLRGDRAGLVAVAAKDLSHPVVLSKHLDLRFQQLGSFSSELRIAGLVAFLATMGSDSTPTTTPETVSFFFV